MVDIIGLSSARFSVEKENDDSIIIRISGVMNNEACSTLLAGLKDTIRRHLFPNDVKIDLSKIVRADDYGAICIEELKAYAAKNGSRISIIEMAEPAKQAFELFSALSDRSRLAEHGNIFDIIPEVGGSFIGGLRRADSSITFIGSVAMAMSKIFIRPRLLRLSDTISFIKKTGVDAIPIIGLLGAIIGLTTAFITSVQLKKIGGNIYIPSMIVFGMVRELGPMLTAIILAGRTGSAYAAEIGTMKISEEIDALFSMGFDPVTFLAVPRIIAMVIATPILTVFSVIFALFGGLLVCVTMFNIQVTPYLQGVSDALFFEDIVWALVKSCVFALIISVAGCMRGFQARGGAAAVGDAATSAVVSGIFTVIVADSLFALIRVYWG